VAAGEIASSATSSDLLYSVAIILLPGLPLQPVPALPRRLAEGVANPCNVQLCFGADPQHVAVQGRQRCELHGHWSALASDSRIDR
jgi:hypothetical protein